MHAVVRAVKIHDDRIYVALSCGDVLSSRSDAGNFKFVLGVQDDIKCLIVNDYYIMVVTNQQSYIYEYIIHGNAPENPRLSARVAL